LLDVIDELLFLDAADVREDEGLVVIAG